MNFARIRREINQLLRDAEMCENLLMYSKARRLRDRALFLEQVLEGEQNFNDQRKKRSKKNFWL